MCKLPFIRERDFAREISYYLLRTYIDLRAHVFLILRREEMSESRNLKIATHTRLVCIDILLDERALFKYTRRE